MRSTSSFYTFLNFYYQYQQIELEIIQRVVDVIHAKNKKERQNSLSLNFLRIYFFAIQLGNHQKELELCINLKEFNLQSFTN